MPASACDASHVQSGIEKCKEGHVLQVSMDFQGVQQIKVRGRCEACNRWVFGKEKVMWCAVCDCSYCSTCAPDARCGHDDNFWVEFLNKFGSALRDAETMKGRIADEISVDLERIRSTFNCQAPGAETLSAEQIVIEHAYEQAKTALNCAAPDTSELHSQEEVFDHSTPRNTSPREEGTVELAEQTTVEKDPPSDLLNLSDEGEGKAEVTGAGVMDLLDLSEPQAAPHVTAPQADMAGPPAANAAAVDLIDIADAPEDKTVVQDTALVNIAPQPAASEVQAETKDVLDIVNLAADETAVNATQVHAAAASDETVASEPPQVHTAAELTDGRGKDEAKDLLDIVTLPVAKISDSVTPDVNAAAEPTESKAQDAAKDLLDITDLPTDKNEANALDNLLDLTVQPSALPAS